MSTEQGVSSKQAGCGSKTKSFMLFLFEIHTHYSQFSALETTWGWVKSEPPAFKACSQPATLSLGSPHQNFYLIKHTQWCSGNYMKCWGLDLDWKLQTITLPVIASPRPSELLWAPCELLPGLTTFSVILNFHFLCTL